MVYKQKNTAVKYVKKFFSEYPESDVITLEQVYIAAGRDNKDKIVNKNWLSNLLTHLKYHGLITSDYSTDTGKRILKGIRLTIEGKRAIGRIEENSVPQQETEESMKTQVKSEITGAYLNIMKEVEQMKKDFPSFEINFDMSMKLKQKIQE
jgi:hypothetical protein